jgi:hypothetical protein
MVLMISALLASPPEAEKKPAAAHGQQAPLFQTSATCMACHNGLSAPSGEDVSIGVNWRSSMMANSSRDPYWQASVRRETIDHSKASAAIEDECAVCHMPMSRYEAKANGLEGEVFAHLGFDPENPADQLAQDGVSCAACHQIEDEKLGTKESFVGRFVINTDRHEGEGKMYGPFETDKGRTRIMRSAAGFRPTEGKHIQKSELCATCHTLYTKALGPDGEVIGELPEQVPYQEWLHSDFRETKSCQSCHMPVVAEEMPITSVLGEPREGMSRHIFVGGNFFMLRMLNRYRADLSVAALPQELEAAAERTIKYLQSESAQIAIDRVELEPGRLVADISIQNLGGHKLPTAYPSRRVWLHVVVRDQNEQIVFESGALNAQGQIEGNDNDSEPARYEPHYTEISSSDQVQIYESIMADQAGRPTTGLLTAVRFVKDNRLLPRGFDKRIAGKDIAVRGNALEDSDFTGGGDQVRYSVALHGAQGPFQVEATLWYQPISYRWASNLREYKAMETERFVTYFDSMSPASGVVLARTVTMTTSKPLARVPALQSSGRLDVRLVLVGDSDSHDHNQRHAKIADWATDGVFNSECWDDVSATSESRRPSDDSTAKPMNAV